MLLSKLIDWIKKSVSKDTYENFVVGLVFGLVYGLVYGLAAGLVYGLAAGLVYGLAAGLAYGLAAGLAYGLVVGLVVGLVYGLAAGLVRYSLISPFLELWLFLLAVFIVSNALMLLFDEVKQKRGEHWLWFIFKREVESFFEWLLISIDALVVFHYVSSPKLAWFVEQLKIFFGWVGVALIVISLFVCLLFVKYSLHKGKLKTKKGG